MSSLKDFAATLIRCILLTFSPLFKHTWCCVTSHILFLAQQGTPHLDVIIGLSQMAAWSWSAPFSKPRIIVCACQRDCLQTVMPLCHTLVQSRPIPPPVCHSGRALVGHWVCYIYLRRHCGRIGTGGALSRRHVRGIGAAVVVKCLSLPALIRPLVISDLNRHSVESLR